MICTSSSSGRALHGDGRRVDGVAGDDDEDVAIDTSDRVRFRAELVAPRVLRARWCFDGIGSAADGAMGVGTAGSAAGFAVPNELTQHLIQVLRERGQSK